jgi:tRNA-specific 2-thiouridylase
MAEQARHHAPSLRIELLWQLAREAGFGDVAEREESQDFIESDSYAPLFEAADNRPGPIVNTAGQELGRHRGIVHYTVGQRQGIGIASGKRLYVKELCAKTNTVVMGTREEVFVAQCWVEDVNWISGEPPTDGYRCRVLPRYHHPGVAAQLVPEPGGVWRVQFEEAQFAVAPGQAAVFYDGDMVVGGGWIIPPRTIPI